MIDPFIHARNALARAEAESDLSPRRATDSEVVISQLMEITHANQAGIVHGGEIMRLVDTAAGMSATKHARRRCVTVAMDEMSFLLPAYLGDVVTVSATVNDAHRTSMEVGVRVDVENMLTGDKRHVSSAHLVFVALDSSFKPTQVPPLIAETPREKRRQAQAQVRREQRLLRKQALAEAGEPND